MTEAASPARESARALPKLVQKEEGRVEPPRAKVVADKAPPRRNWTFVKIFIALLVAASAYGAYAIYTRLQPYEWSGTVEARTVALGSRVGGRVKNVLVREGEPVKAGQVLLDLEPGDLEAQRAQLEAELMGARAELDKLANGSLREEIAQATARLEEARATVAQASARQEQATKLLERVKPLSGLTVPAAEYDAQLATSTAASSSLAEASARASSADAALRLLRKGAREEEIRSRQAQVAAAQARLEILKVHLGELAVRAPADARVETLTVRPGDILAPNAPAVSVLESGQIYVLIYVPEPLIGKIAVGQDVPIQVDSFPGRPFPGRVDHINRVGEFTPRNLQTVDERSDQVFGARITVLDGERDLRAGMTAFIKVAKK